MPERRRRSRTAPANNAFSFGGATRPEPTAWLVNLTDLGLVGALWLVTGWFGGRTPVGQFLLCLCACVAAGAWSAHQLISAERRWVRTGSELLWLAAGMLFAVQVVELPVGWLHTLAPRMSDYLPLWFGEQNPALPRDAWRTLSLAPGATLRGISQLSAYGLLFLTAGQRLQKLRDIERLLQWIAIAAASWAAFGLFQYAFYNGKYYWVIETPAAFSGETANGPFTNRNHFAQFLSLGIGPLVWCTISACTQESRRASSSSSGNSSGVSMLAAGGWGLALGVTVLASVLTLSRGGFLAMACAIGVPLLVMLWRFGARHAWIVAVLGVVVLGSGLLGLDQLMSRFVARGDNGRWPIWVANWRVACDFPWVGTGIGTHINAHQLHLTTPVILHEYTHAESSFLQVASETGFVGLAIAAMAVLLALYGPVRVIISGARREQALAASAILGGLLGNFVHALADFIWYVPSCMVALLLLSACGSRLFQMVRAELISYPASQPATLLGWSGITGGVAIAGFLGIVFAANSAQGEAFARRYHQLAWQSPSRVKSLTAEDLQLHEREKMQAALAAARADTQDSRMQLAAARTCLRQFERSMQTSDCPMTIQELRDAALASQFPTAEEAQAWVKQVAGKRWRLLDAAERFAIRAVKASPLEGRAYLVLAELAFLHDLSGQAEKDLIQQALKVRPYDPVVRYDAGQREILAGNVDAAVEHWTFTFAWDPSQRLAIARMLANVCTAETLIEKLRPDWESAAQLVAAFEMAGRSEDCAHMRQLQARLAVDFAAEHPADPANEKAWLTATDAFGLLGDVDASLQVLQQAVEQQPQQPNLRKRLGAALLSSGQPQAAIEHLKWAAGRRPDDENLGRLLEQAYRQNRLTEAGRPPLH